ncbi:OTU domain-containing protein 5-B isoform X2 [Dermacentor silvarum]|uniref:OTU domain-containing protein 5-B isoform X2 n=1 Tax=Dermacentor silvarum TaxID=543639 RepID=UPI001897586E|nr:OTU domain-containing protein 5-B isoform X2 [Dermacentor silvarum]
MTILPTKKSSQSKSEGDGSDPSSFHGDRHGHSGHSAEQYNFANRNSPPRWAAPNASSRDEKRPAHATASGFDEFDAVDGGPSHSKRRHRASPHRSLRKAHHRSAGIVVKPSTSQGANSPAVEDSASGREDADPSGYNSGDEYDKPPELWTNEEYKEREYHFEKKLRKKGLLIKNMGEDGACLFRAVADQVYGDQEMHKAVRKLCMDYMAKNSDYYSQYVTEDFDKYLERKRCDHIHGNHIEMQAMSEMFNRPIEVYHYSSEPINIFHGGQQSDNEPIRLSYHRNVHYNSIVDPYKATVGVGLGLPSFKPGLADKTLVKEALRASEELQLEQAMLEDKLRATDWEATSEALEEQVARESYLHWLRENEMRARKKTRSATATSSSSLSPLVDVGGNTAASGASSSPRGGRASPRSRASPRTPPLGGAQALSDQSDSGTHAGDGKGLTDWEDTDIIARVLAQSQQEYLDSLKRASATNAPAPGSPARDNSDCAAAAASSSSNAASVSS